MWVGKLEAVLEILFEGSVFGKIDFVECNVIKRDILVEQGREGVDDIGDAAPVDNRVDEGGADVFGKANCGSLYIDQLLKTGLMISEMVQLDGMWMIGNPISFAVRMVSSSRESR